MGARGARRVVHPDRRTPPASEPARDPREAASRLPSGRAQAAHGVSRRPASPCPRGLPATRAPSACAPRLRRFPAPSRAIAVKASSNRSSIESAGTSTRSQSGARISPSSVGSAQSAKRRTKRPMMSIAVPGSLTAGDSARLAISERTMSPKRGSSSNFRSSAIGNARVIGSVSSSAASPESART